jgi:hypothetical protein
MTRLNYLVFSGPRASSRRARNAVKRDDYVTSGDVTRHLAVKLLRPGSAQNGGKGPTGLIHQLDPSAPQCLPLP